MVILIIFIFPIHECIISLHLFVSISTALISFHSFPRTDLVRFISKYLVRFISRFFILSHPNINGIVSLISSSDIWLLVYRKATYFYIVIMYLQFY